MATHIAKPKNNSLFIVSKAFDLQIIRVYLVYTTVIPGKH